MSQYKTENDYFEQVQEEDDPEVEEYYRQREKPKRLTQRRFNPQFQEGYNRSPATEIVAWSFIGLVGLAMTVGSVIVASNSPEEWVIVIPLVYMLGAMWLMRR
ncbi:MAG TPA: hypothetical protein VJZ27_06700 [Aggregatilineales bacterium]|nr:hypothetical protein [Aggregatilineales bacterium]